MLSNIFLQRGFTKRVNNTKIYDVGVHSLMLHRGRECTYECGPCHNDWSASCKL